MSTSKVCCVVLLCTIGIHGVLSFWLQPGDMENGDQENRAGMFETEKRGGWKAMAFPCNIYDNKPLCRNGGRGPKVSRTKLGLICMCICPGKWSGPECGMPDARYAKRGFGGPQKFWKH